MTHHGTLINQAASLGARAVVAREAAERMPHRKPRHKEARDAALASAADMALAAEYAWSHARMATAEYLAGRMTK